MNRRPSSATKSVETDVRGVGRSAFARNTALAVLGLLFLGFSALGVWQVERRAWKLGLIDRVDRRIHALAVPVPERSAWIDVDPGEWEYRHVTITGRFLSDAGTAVQAVTERGAGYWVLTPLRTADGAIVLVNRGFVPERPAMPRRAGTVGTGGDGGTLETVTGLLRLTEPGGGFLRRNDATNDRWFSRDVVAIARARGLGPVAPYFIDADASGTEMRDAPVGGLTVVRFHNNHLVYALTWFALAVMTAAAAWQLTRDDRRRRRTRSRSAARAVDTPS